MDHRECQSRFLAEAEGSLDRAGSSELLEHLAGCQECRDAHRQYRAICYLEKEVAASVHPSPDLAGKIMAALAEEAAPAPAAPSKPIERAAQKTRPAAKASDLYLVVRSLSAVACILALTLAALIYDRGMERMRRPPLPAPAAVVVHTAAHEPEKSLPSLVTVAARTAITGAPGLGKVLSFNAEETKCSSASGRCLKVTLLLEPVTEPAAADVPETAAEEHPEIDIGHLVRNASLEL